MREKVQALALATFLTVGIVVPSLAFAQDGANRPYFEPKIPPSPASVISGSGPTASVGGKFSSVWLLPLVAIPFIVYLLWPKKKNESSWFEAPDSLKLNGSSKNVGIKPGFFRG